MRENALQQAAVLLDYKRAFCHHPSHLGPKREDEGGILSVFVSLLAEPLSRTGNARTDADHLTIELVLHLFRNLLAAEPLLKTPGSENLHHEFITLLDRELVLEVLLVLAADIEQRENAPYNLLLMELLQLLLRHQDPIVTAKSSLPPKIKEKENTKAAGSLFDKPRGKLQPAPTGLLMGPLHREKQALAASATSRHSHFGGTLVVEKSGGRKQLVSAALLSNNNRRLVTEQQQPKRRKNKKAEPFIGALRHRENSPAAIRAAATLHTFCLRFVSTCYGPVMKSLKNEFRRDSVRLEDGDRVVFFQIVWFFCQWWRTARGLKLLTHDDSTKSTSCIGQLIFTMDVFTFNLVLNATDTFQEHKKHGPLAHAVALLSEMMHLLHIMRTSMESTEQIMAMGLMDRLFYGNEPLDRLPKLLSRWTPGSSTREYLCDLTEVSHMTLKSLDANAAACVSNSTQDGKTTNDDDTAKHDTVAKMKAIAADFDAHSYFARKIVSNHTVFMYAQLLSQYAINAPHVNHRIITFFLRLSQHKITLGDEANADAYHEDIPKNPLAAKTVTFQPMLYNVHVLAVLNTILNDVSIRKDKEYATLLQFSAAAVQNFATAAQANSMLFVEALFKHPLPHRFCDLSTNLYVTDDLRMLAERNLLLQQQQKLEEETAALARDDGDDDSEDEELEFTDVPTTTASVSKAKPAAKSRIASDGIADYEGGEEDPKDNDHSKNALADRDDDSDANGKIGNRLKRTVGKSSQRAHDMPKRNRELSDDAPSSDEEGIFGHDEAESSKDLPKAKKGRKSIFSDSEDDD